MFKEIGQLASLMRNLPKLQQEAEQLKQKLNKIVTEGAAGGGNGASGIYAGPGAAECTISGNVIADNLDMGVAVAPEAQAVTIRQNQMLRNAGLGIDVGLDGPSGPELAPVIHSIRREGERDIIVTISARTADGGPVFVDFYVNDGPDGVGTSRCAPGSSTSSSALPHTSGRITMPAPPPNGVSSTVRWRSVVQSRRSCTRRSSSPAWRALPTSDRSSGAR